MEDQEIKVKPTVRVVEYDNSIMSPMFKDEGIISSNCKYPLNYKYEKELKMPYQINDRVIVILDRDCSRTIERFGLNLRSITLFAGTIVETNLTTSKVNGTIEYDWSAILEYDIPNLYLKDTIHECDIVGKAREEKILWEINPEDLEKFSDPSCKEQVVERYNKLYNNLEEIIKKRNMLAELDNRLNIHISHSEVKAKKILALCLRRFFVEKNVIPIKQYINFLNNHFDFTNYLKFINTNKDANSSLNNTEKVVARNLLSDIETLESLHTISSQEERLKPEYNDCLSIKVIVECK